MRGLLLLIAAGLVGGCYGSDGLQGQADSTVDPVVEAPTDRLLEPELGTDPRLDLIEDTIEEEWPATTEGCGNGVVEDEEECDDGDLNDCNGCSSECRWERAVQVRGDVPGAFVEDGSYPCLPCTYTIEVWFRFDEEVSGVQLFNFPGFASFSLGIYGGGSFRYTLENVYGSGGGDRGDLIDTHTWHHYAVSCWPSWPDDKIGHFIDGLPLRDVGTWVARMPTCDGRMLILGSPPSEIDLPHVAATVDELRVSDEGIYRADTPFIPERRLSIRPDTVALWNFNQEVDGVIPDISGNGHDAVLVEGTLVPDDCHLP